MKILHTSDWHLGRTLKEYPLLEDQSFRLAQLAGAVREQGADAVVIAGDLYDRSVPPAQAVSCLDELLYSLTQELKVPVLAIAGNHDSPERLSFGSRLFSGAGLFVEGKAAREIRRVTLKDILGEVDFYLLPYFTPEEVRPWFPEQDIRTFDQAFQALLEQNRSRIDPARRNVLIAHGFYQAVSPEKAMDDSIFSESEISIGQSDLMDLSPAAGLFDYIALGHLHAPQTAGAGHIRYGGSLLKYSTSEARQKKGFTLVELGEKGRVDVSLLEPPPKRDLRTIRGTLESLLADNEPSEDYIMAILTDEGALLDAMPRLREKFPHILGIRFAAREQDISPESASQAFQRVEQLGRLTPFQLFERFYEQVRGEPLSEQRRELVQEAVRAALEQEEESEK